jgi:exodeoxyribonuclease VII small subunit
MQFETAYSRLEQILEAIQSGNASLEDSLKLYEEADQLIQWCSKTLQDAEKKIEIIVKNRDGTVQTQPFSEQRPVV